MHVGRTHSYGVGVPCSSAIYPPPIAKRTLQMLFRLLEDALDTTNQPDRQVVSDGYAYQ